jgi:AcrR family transcriptional regulator
LLDAAEEVFARRGFEGASLEEIAETAGYTRGAIYKHFGGKEDLFLEANKRFNERYVHAFVDVIDPSTPIEALDLKAIAARWRELRTTDAQRFALGAEFDLYVVRNPETRKRVAVQRRQTAEMVARFMEEQAARIGASMRMPSLTLARIALAASDGIQLAAYLDGDGDGDDLLEAFLELLVSAWEPAEPPPRQPVKKAAKKAAKTRN